MSRFHASRVSLNRELIEAAAEGDVRWVRKLLDRGADVNARGALGGTPLHWAAREGRLSVARLLLDRGADVNAETRLARPRCTGRLGRVDWMSLSFFSIEVQM